MKKDHPTDDLFLCADIRRDLKSALQKGMPVACLWARGPRARGQVPPSAPELHAHFDTMRIEVGVQFLFAKDLIYKGFAIRFNETRLCGDVLSSSQSLDLFCSAVSFNDRSVVCAFFQQVCASFNDSLLCSPCYSDNGAAAHRGA